MPDHCYYLAISFTNHLYLYSYIYSLAMHLRYSSAPLVYKQTHIPDFQLCYPCKCLTRYARSPISMCMSVYACVCVVERKTSKYTDLQSLQGSGLLNSFTTLDATWHFAFGQRFSLLKIIQYNNYILCLYVALMYFL